MSNNLLQDPDFQSVIQKHLSNEAGTTLKAILEKAEKDAALVEAQKTTITNLQGDVNRLNETLTKHGDLATREENVKKREDEVTTKETNQKIAELTYQLEAEKDKTSFSKSVALGLVRNIEYRKNIHDFECIPGVSYHDSQGNYHNIPPRGQDKNLTQTEEAH